MSNRFLAPIWSGLGGDAADLAIVEETGRGTLPSVFAVAELAAASIGAAGLAAAKFAEKSKPEVVVDRRLASLWFFQSAYPQGWSPPPPWDPIAGDYLASDGWIRLHTNAPRHRAAALEVLGAPAQREAVARAVANWRAEALEEAVVARGGCAAAMRSIAQWAQHAQGAAVAAEPLARFSEGSRSAHAEPAPGLRPLANVSVLDLTRVLAGPVATRFLAGLGAEVLRLDPPDWDEPALAPDVTLGKRCARLDLKGPEGRARLEQLLQSADVLMHGYRPGALDRLGFDAAARQSIRPGLVDVSLDAYGWTGPWRERRGFDSLVQMSCGIADAGMTRLGKDKPFPLPVQALDHACGYLMAAAALLGLARRRASGRGEIAQLSLARVAALLVAGPAGDSTANFAAAGEADFAVEVEQTAWGPLRRLISPVTIAGHGLHWLSPAGPLGAATPEWRPRVS